MNLLVPGSQIPLHADAAKTATCSHEHTARPFALLPLSPEHTPNRLAVLVQFVHHLQHGHDGACALHRDSQHRLDLVPVVALHALPEPAPRVWWWRPTFEKCDQGVAEKWSQAVTGTATLWEDPQARTGREIGPLQALLIYPLVLFSFVAFVGGGIVWAAKVGSGRGRGYLGGLLLGVLLCNKGLGEEGVGLTGTS